jgi:hypothetical protein
MELFNNRRQLNQEQEILVKDILRSIKIERKKLVQLFLTRSVGVAKKFTSKKIF